MRNWIIVGLVILALGAVWFVLTEPSSEPPKPGALSSHQVDEEQPFDPYLDDEPAPAEEEAASTEEEPATADGSEADVAQERGTDSPTDDGAADAGEPEGTTSEGSADADQGRDEPPGGEGSEQNAGPSDETLAQAEASQIADTYLDGASTDPARNLELYAERVNYYDQGTVSRSEVLRDKRHYLDRWPERHYERTSDVEIVDAGSADLIRFNYRFRVSGGSRTAQGTGWAELGVQRRDGRTYIVSERGGVTDRE